MNDYAMGVVLLASAQILAFTAAKKEEGITYAEAMRAAARQLQMRQEECKKMPHPLCMEEATAAWRKAVALAEAKRRGTKEAWKEAERVIRLEDDRLRMLRSRNET